MTNLLPQLWQRLAGEAYSPIQLAATLRKDGGHDIINLSDKDLLDLIEGCFSGDWAEPAFSFSELLAYYASFDGRLQPRQVVGWVFAAAVVGRAIQFGAADIFLQFDIFIDGFMVVRSELEVDECIEIFQGFIQPLRPT